MIFWKHIKGLNSTLYSYIRFMKGTPSAEMQYLPKIYMNTTGDFNDTIDTDCGHIITSKISGGSIENSFTFNGDLTIENFLYPQQHIQLNKGKKIYWGTDSSGCFLTTYGTDTVQLTGRSESVNIALGDSITITSDSDVNIYNGIFSHKIRLQPKAGQEQYDGSCTATYFNATSDYRAKKDFKLLEKSALNIVCNTPVYSFKYKESDIPSIGIIAQDVQNIKFGEFDLVDNKEASGENYNYMTIHESKLIYILWRAIQEQQEEIQELKEQLKNKN